ncbi:hypothetical protein BH23GEM9_BH23GEM9_12460 [soil metagenome]
MDFTTAPPSSASSLSEASRQQLLHLMARLADPVGRSDAAAALARRLGGSEIIVFIRDDAVDALLPAPGFRQRLEGSAEWRAALASAARDGEWRGTLPGATGQRQPALAVSAGADAALVVSGIEDATLELETVVVLLPLLAAALSGEHQAVSAASQQKIAAESAARASALTSALDAARARLQAALISAEQARPPGRAGKQRKGRLPRRHEP